MGRDSDQNEAIWGVANAIVRLAKAQEEANRLSSEALKLAECQSRVTAQLESALAAQIAREDDGSSDST